MATNNRTGSILQLVSTHSGATAMGGANLGIFLPLEALEPRMEVTQDGLRELVSQLNRDDALVTCSVLNSIVSGSGAMSGMDRQRKALSTVCTQNDLARLDAWSPPELAQGVRASSKTVLFRGQLLELIRWIAQWSDRGATDGASFDRPEVKHAFMRAALMASEFWRRRVYRDSLDDVAAEDTMTNALSAFRKATEESGEARFIGITLGRSDFLYQDFLPTRLPTFEEDFRANTGISFADFISCAMMVDMHAWDKAIDGYIFKGTNARLTARQHEFEVFLAIEAQTPDQLAERLTHQFQSEGYKAIIERPILRVADGRFTVMDPHYFSDHFTTAPLFKTFRGNKSDNQRFGALGDAFEDYALSVLERIYKPASSFLVQRLYPNLKSPDGVRPEFEIDALINEGKDLVVMEMKSAFLKETVFLTDDVSAFLAEVRSKYAQGKTARERRKGVAQLATCIRAIVDGSFNDGGIDRQLVRQIFPVLVVHDERMGSPGMNIFLDSLFNEFLGELPGRIRIAPLTVMTIADLEHQESSDGFTMTELLGEYCKLPAGHPMSLHNFMARSEFTSRIRPPQSLIDRSLALGRRIQLDLFPKPEGAVTAEALTI